MHAPRRRNHPRVSAFRGRPGRWRTPDRRWEIAARGGAPPPADMGWTVMRKLTQDEREEIERDAALPQLDARG